MITAMNHSVPDRIKPSFVIFDIWPLLTLMAERQSSRMSKITNDGLCSLVQRILYGCTHTATVGVKELY